jgi:ABC-type Fe3+-hydroxamate transport system substrate-binding protein
MPVLRFRLHTDPHVVPASLIRLVACIACCTPAVLAGGCTRTAPARADRTSNAAPPAPSGSAIRDDFGRAVVTDGTARRVVSLNPTTTETIFAIGAGSRLVGRSRWDEWPAAARAVRDMGDGIGPNVEEIVAARPDLVVLYATEDNRSAAERLESAGIRTLSLRIDRVADFDRDTRLLGRVLGDSAQAALVADSVIASLRRVQRATSGLSHPSVEHRAAGRRLARSSGRCARSRHKRAD